MRVAFASAAEKARSMFFSIVSHDIRQTRRGLLVACTSNVYEDNFATEAFDGNIRRFIVQLSPSRLTAACAFWNDTLKKEPTSGIQRTG